MRRITHYPTLCLILSLCNDGTGPTANFQFVPVRVFEKESIIAGAVFGADLRSFEVLAAGVTNQLRDLVDLFAFIRPKRDTGAVWPMILVLDDAKKFRC